MRGRTNENRRDQRKGRPRRFWSSTPHPTTFGGHRAVDVRIEIGDGTMHELIVRTPNHVFMILVGGEGDPAKEFYDFRDSVELLV